MMVAALAWFRLDVRRRWRSLLMLALLVALAAGTVMTATAGARRGDSAVDRLWDRTLPATVAVLPTEPAFDWEAVRALPEVDALSTFAFDALYLIDEAPPRAGTGAGQRVRDDEQAGVFPAGDDEVMRTIERPVVLDGRLADPARADEVVISPAFEHAHGLGVGDTVTLRLYAPETQDVVGDDGSSSVAEPDGPAVRAQIVGVIRSPWFLDEVGDTDGVLVPSPGLLAQHTANLLGTSQSGTFNALVRLRGGEADIPAFRAGLERVSNRSDIDLINLPEQARRDQEVTEFEADALLAFALAAGLAAVFLVGQAVARYSASAVADLQVLRALGLTSRQLVRVAAAGPALAAVAGTSVGVAGAVVASRWFPIGTASLIEPAPGFDADLPVLLAGAVVVPLSVASGAAAAARFVLRSARSGATSRRSVVATAAARAGAPVPLVVGAKFALERGRGRQAVPVRPALIGSVVGVLGVVAAFTLSDGVDDAAANPSRFGQVHQLETLLGVSGEDFGPVDDVLTVLAADPDVVAVNDTRLAIAEAAHVPVTLFTLDPVGTPWLPVVIEGRVPAGPGEVALAPRSAEAMGAAVGDIVPMTGTSGVRELAVTGLAYVAEGPQNDYVTGGWVTADGYDALFDQDSAVLPAFKFHAALLALRPGAVPAAVADRIEQRIGVAGLLVRPETPSSRQEVLQVRTLPVFLAGFLAVLALGAVGHALATAVRRRRHDVAVLRALGMTQPQSRAVVATQATVLALIGLVVGVPLGVALGRTVWRYVAETMPLFYVAPVALVTLVLVAPGALVAANLLAAWPARRAASMRVAHILRAE